MEIKSFTDITIVKNALENHVKGTKAIIEALKKQGIPQSFINDLENKVTRINQMIKELEVDFNIVLNEKVVVEPNIKPVEKILKLEKKDKLYILDEKEVDTLFNALIFARDENGGDYEGDFDTASLDKLINKIF